jgi:hypothetical protein
MLISERIKDHPQPVMAGLDPAIQTLIRATVQLADWMAASRAAMTRSGTE